ncbi:MAG: hypothetical protein FJY88_06415 [Candidatus Eisenbacteria bacterium]|nr:hypothetical protein [Candidatus Eisenbacteria bacterium]
MKSPRRSDLTALLAVACLLVLTVCGDDDKKGVEPEVQAAGRFLDSPVEGLSYESGSLSGVTTADGGFKYIAGSSARFSVGSIVLGEGNGKSVMTPVDLVSWARDENNQTVTNICRFLLTLDDDADPDGGITITNDVRMAASGKSVNFNQAPGAFGSDPNVTTTVAELTALTAAGQRHLVAASDAQAHLRWTLLGIFSGSYSGRYDGGDTGSWTITVDSEGTLSGVVHADDGYMYTVWGDVRSSGDANFAEGGVSVCGGVFSGAITTDGSISGTWVCEMDPDYSGTFSGRKDDDTTPPAAVQDLRVGAVTASSVTLRWTSPGDDGNDGTAAGYDVRYSTSSGASWDEMTQATGEPAPKPAGGSETFAVAGLTSGTTYYFRLRTADEVPNWSDASNMPSGTPSFPLPDFIPPAAVTDLTASSPTSSSLLLTWTAPGDDGDVGTASQYDVRYAPSPVTPWDDLTQAAGEPPPNEAGQPESFRVTGLSSNTTYYFQLKAADEVPNWSDVSNQAGGTTAGGSGSPSHLSWELTDGFFGTMLASGDADYPPESLHVEVMGAFYRVWLGVWQEFRVGASVFPQDSPEEFAGFGMWLERSGHSTFSWDWFVVQSDSIASKAQGGGEVVFHLKRVDSKWQLSSIRVLSDCLLRCTDEEDDSTNVVDPGYGVPYRWGCTLSPGSYLSLAE